jgi:hypothetical protein
MSSSRALNTIGHFTRHRRCPEYQELKIIFLQRPFVDIGCVCEMLEILDA